MLKCSVLIVLVLVAGCRQENRDQDAAKAGSMAGEQAGESQLAGKKAPGSEGQSAGETENPILAAYTTHAGQGNVEAQFMLGIMYQNGQGVAADINQSVKWYCKAAEQGHADVQEMLGQMYREGWGVARDLAEAAKWFGKAAAQGNKNARQALEGVEGKLESLTG